MFVLWTSDPDVPVTVTVACPRVALEAAVKVNVEFTAPLAGGVTGLGENCAVTPVGRPVAVSDVAELKPFWLVMVIVLGALPPCCTVTEEGDALIVKFAVPPEALTVSEILVVACRLPDVPVIVIGNVPVVAVALAVNVTVLLVVAGLGLKTAVTPLGSAEVVRLTLPLNPF